MSKIDPFEAFKNRREIELLEGRFKKQAEDQQKRVDEAYSEGDADAAVVDRVTLEMEDFFKQSTDTVEKVIEKITGQVSDEAIEKALEQVAAASPDAEPDEPDEPDRPDEPEFVMMSSAPSPAVSQKLDLRAALARIRQYQSGPPATSDEFEESFGDPASQEPSENPVSEEVSIEVTQIDEPALPPAPAAFEEEPAFPDPEPIAATEVSGEFEPASAMEAAPELTPTLEELAEEVRRLKTAIKALLQKGILTPEDLEV